ncbi:MAG: fatty acid desaturase [Alphaproteobacteria bacterium]|nr:fatty acid desaturase [Alphaproteobacteria bacterium]
MAEADGKARDGRLLAPDELRALTLRSNRHGALRLAIHLGLIAAAAGLVTVTRGGWLVVPAMLPLGWFLVALFAVVHECVHYTAFRTRLVNDVAAWIAGVPSLLDATFYRYFHYAHHRHCQDPARDPELTPPPPATLGAYVRRMTALAYWEARLRNAWRVLRGDFAAYGFIPERSRAAARRSMVATVLAAAVVLAGWSVLDPWGPLLYWIGPVVLAQPILRAILLTEHTLCSADGDAFRNTRTTLVSWPVRLVHWNMPFHAEHHLYPSIPFHALPAAHRRLGPHLAHVAHGYAGTHRAILKDLASTP